MNNSVPNKNNSSRLFENHFLESLTRTPFWLPITFFYLVSAVILTYLVFENLFTLGFLVILYFSGMIFFSLVEYLIHRFFFHLTPSTDKQKKMMHTVHGIHHKHPRDKERLVMPIVLSLSLSVLFFFLFRLIIPDFYLGFFAGFIAGYSTYLLVHYAVHAYRPPKNIFRYWWKHHAIHHYKSDEVAFAVSLPLWDYLFGTMPEKK